MLYQLSYASAAQTEQAYQKRNQNCKEGFKNSSMSGAKAVGNSSSYVQAAKNHLLHYL